MRKPIAAILAGLLSCSSVVAAEPALLLPSESAFQRRNRLNDRSPWRPCAKRSASRREMGVCRRLLSSRLRRTRAG